MELWKVLIRVTNSVNDNEQINIKYVSSEDEAKEIVAEAQKKVDEWNAPDYSYSRTSIRWLESAISKVEDDTVLDGLTMGTLITIISNMKKKGIYEC